MTELDAYLIVQNAAIEALGEPAIVYGDFASGPRTASRARAARRRRGRSSRATCSCSTSRWSSRGYRGDFTNTFAVGGGPTPRQRELFDACVGALQRRRGPPRSPARPPATSTPPSAATSRRSASTTPSPPTPGHGLGLGHPEPPYFVPESDETLEAGDVVAIEPGLYIEGVGGMRFERNYLITADGFETLSNHEIRIDQ